MVDSLVFKRLSEQRNVNERRGAAALGLMLGRILSRELTHTITPLDAEIIVGLTRSARYLPAELQEIILNTAAQVQLEAVTQLMGE